jgi:small subunit ribosomal protein S20
LPGKPAEKQGKSTEEKRLRNKSVRSRNKTTIKEAEQSIAAGDAEKAKNAVTTAVSTLDRATAKGVIHPNNAARRKSRLVKKLNKARPA